MRADIHDGQGAKTLRSMGRIQMRETNYLQIVKSGLHRTAGPYRSAKKRHNRLAGTPAGAATLAASRCNGRDQPDAHASNQYSLGQLDPYPQSIVEYVAVSLTRRLMYGDCATPDRRQWQLSLLSIGARPCTPRLICFRKLAHDDRGTRTGVFRQVSHESIGPSGKDKPFDTGVRVPPRPTGL